MNFKTVLYYQNVYETYPYALVARVKRADGSRYIVYCAPTRRQVAEFMQEGQYSFRSYEIIQRDRNGKEV